VVKCLFCSSFSKHYTPQSRTSWLERSEELVDDQGVRCIMFIDVKHPSGSSPRELNERRIKVSGLATFAAD